MSSLPEDSQPAHPSWWQWPTILSLDAPAIALTWQALVGQMGGVVVQGSHRFVLAASVWLAYTIDRWIEAGRLDRALVSTARHGFHQKWRLPIALVALVVLAADVTVAVATLAAADLWLGLAVAGAAAAYVLSHQWLHRHAPFRVPKELCIAALLTAGVWLFVRDGTGAPFWSALGLFAALCFTNTGLISRWEADVDRRHGQWSLALASAAARTWIRWLPWLAVVVAAAVGMAVPDGGRPAACAALSGGLLAVIDLVETRVGRAVARVLADAALLAPLLWLTWS